MAAVVSPMLLDPPAASSHLVQFYDGPKFFAEAIGGYLEAGFSRGESAVVIAVAKHREALVETLRDRGHDVDALVGDDRFVLLDADALLATFMRDGAPDRTAMRAAILPTIDRALSRGAPLRAFGEMVDVLARRGDVQAAIRLEELWNEIAAERTFTLLCGYSMSSFPRANDAESFRHVCATHTHVLPSERTALADEGADARLRRVALLEQRAHALEAEIEERKRIEERLRTALAHRDDFIAVAGHELRTPLTAMKLQLDALLAHVALDPDTRAHRHADRTRRSLGRLVSLVDRVLDVSRMSQMGLALELDEVDLVDVARAAMDDQVQGVKNGSTLTLDAPPSLHGRWDAVRLEELFVNLLSNAIKYGRGKPIDLRIERRAGGARVSVIDRGHGVAPEDRERIFERFERAVPSTNFGGLGLGLWISRKIVEAHGGTLTLDARPGETAFVVDLPLESPPRG